MYKEGKGMISISDLRKNGWKDNLIKTLLGEPDLKFTNPYCPTGPKARMYKRKSVEIAEKTVLFQNHRTRSNPITESSDLSDFFS